MTHYLVLGIKNADRYGVDYVSPFLDSYTDAYAAAANAIRMLGDSARTAVIENPFVDNRLIAVYAKADFEEAGVG